MNDDKVSVGWFIPGMKDSNSEKGGQGSGNFGHAGRPGHLGGSAAGGSAHAGIEKPADAHQSARNALLKKSISSLRKLQTKIETDRRKAYVKIPESDMLEGAKKTPDMLRFEQLDDDWKDVTWAILNHPSWDKKK